MKKMYIVLTMVLLSSGYLSAQDTCSTELGEGLELFEAEKYAEAKVKFETAKTHNCDNAQSWIDRCNEKLKSPINQSKSLKKIQCEQRWKDGKGAYDNADYETALIFLKKGLDENCDNADFADYMELCNIKLEQQRSEACSTTLNKGIALFEAKQYAEAKDVFESAKKIPGCDKVQTWIDRCDEKLKAPTEQDGSITQIQCEQRWKDGKEAYDNGDYETALIFLKRGLNENCNNADFADYMELCNIKLKKQQKTEPDQDNDGVPDTEDRCPDVAGPAVHKGCPEMDGDGHPDIVDISDPSLLNKQIVEDAEEIDEIIPFAIVEDKPKFQGEDAKTFVDWINSKVVYPQQAIENNTQGTVRVSFTVNIDGSISDVRSLGKIDPLLEDCVIEIVKKSPKWTPGRQQNKPVKVTYQVPVVFKLQPEIKQPETNATALDETQRLLKKPIVEDANDVDIIPFAIVEKKPVFQGKDAKTFVDWIYSKMVYPQQAIENNIQGTVRIAFTINIDGSISNIKSLVKIDPLLEECVIEIVKKSPKWTPGYARNKPVKVIYQAPVVFKLEQ
jgi:protein TonB